MPSTRRHLGFPSSAVAALSVAGALAVSACGDGLPPARSPSGSPTTAGAEPGRTQAVAALRRSGGVAGFDDRLSAAADGRVTGTTRTGAVDCTVTAQAVTTLTTAPGPQVAPAAGNDRMTVTLRRDDELVDLGEGQGGDPLSMTARTLLDDVQLPSAQRTLCR